MGAGVWDRPVRVYRPKPSGVKATKGPEDAIEVGR